MCVCKQRKVSSVSLSLLVRGVTITAVFAILLPLRFIPDLVHSLFKDTECFSLQWGFEIEIRSMNISQLGVL